MPSRKSGNFAAVAAKSHRTPPPASGAGCVINKQAAGGIRAAAQRGARAFGDNLRRRARNGCQEPFKALFPRAEFQLPIARFVHQLVVALGDGQDFVDGRNEGFAGCAAAGHGEQRFPNGRPQTHGSLQELLDGRRRGVLPLEKIAEALR